MKEMTFEIL